MRISVTIITRNRAQLLDRCLTSIDNQRAAPFEVIVVDNASTDHTLSVINKYKKILPIKSIRETRIGIPYARNAGIKIAKGDVVAFLDDDCTSNPQWILSIKRFFKQYSSAVGVIGNTLPANNRSIPALVEFAYNRRWVLTHLKSLETRSKILSGLAVDFKNSAFRLNFIKQFQFSSHTPYGDVGNEDTEIGYRMFKKNHNILYDPSIMVLHHYSETLSRLLWRNFWGGHGDALLLLQNGVDLRSSVSKPSIHEWVFLCHKISKHLPVFQKALFFLLIFIYPLFSRVGRFFVKITWVLKLPISIPQR